MYPPFKLTLDSLESSEIKIRRLQLALGKVAIADEEWEPVGPTPMPTALDLRGWDLTVLSRYRPLYMPTCDFCCLCAYGKCDLSGGLRGACGIDMLAHQGRLSVLTCSIGAATHASHARSLLNRMALKHGYDVPIKLGSEIDIEMPLTRLITGIRPRTIGDLDAVLRYVEEQIVQLLATAHVGQENSTLDFESKALHLGMLDHLAMEVADVCQVVSLGFPMGDPNAPLISLGMGHINPEKPLVLCIGHNVSDGVEVIEFMERSGLGRPGERLEVAGLCCTAHDVARYDGGSKIIGPVSHQLRFIRTGMPDVLILDEQCIHSQVVSEAQRLKSCVIAVSEKACYGLPDLTDRPTDEIVSALLNGLPGAVILDPDKVGAVAALVALNIAPRRSSFKSYISPEVIRAHAINCDSCGRCRRNCPLNLPVDVAVAIAKRGDVSSLASLGDACLGCARCEPACPHGIPVLSLIEAAGVGRVVSERFKIRVGRGPILDTEIRRVSRAIVFGEIPGVIAIAGCANYPYGRSEVGGMAEEFLRRRYIVTASGCSALAISMYRTESGGSLYEEYPGVFDAGGLVNVGSCVATSHISGALIKIANIFAKKPLRANYEEIADYVLNRVGACGLVWGVASQKASSIIAGFNRLGVPVVVGPQGAKLRKVLMGKEAEASAFTAYDARTGEEAWVGPAPQHLLYAAENKAEALVMASKLCIRPSDTTMGRAIKLSNYIELYKIYYQELPKDLHLFVRSEADIPVSFKEEVADYLKGAGWRPSGKPSVDPTLLKRLCRR